MSLFGSLMGDIDDDVFGNPMQAMNMHMRSMNRLMNSFMPDPFNMLTPYDNGGGANALMERSHHPAAGQMNLFGFPAMPNINRLLNTDIGSPNGASYCSSSVISMSSGPDGRPQIYQATSSSKTGPGGIRETRKTVQDSSRGIKKMAIGHHIGERAHIIEKEQDLNSGQLEEHQEFINLDEEQAEDFNREFTSRAHMGGRAAIAGVRRDMRPQRQVLSIEPLDDDEDDDQQYNNSQNRRQLPALPPAAPTAPSAAHPHHHQQAHNSSSKAVKSATSTVSDATNDTNDTNDSKSSTATASSSNNNYNYSNSKQSGSNNSNNNYVSRTAALRAYRNQLAGATPRRPLRTPPSSPLTTTPPTSHRSATTNTLSDWRLHNPRFYRK